MTRVEWLGTLSTIFGVAQLAIVYFEVSSGQAKRSTLFLHREKIYFHQAVPKKFWLVECFHMMLGLGMLALGIAAFAGNLKP